MKARRKAKLLVTLGPATDAPGVVDRLVAAGIDGVRLNLSHGPHTEHARRLRALRKAAKSFGCHVPVMLDLRGPKIRVGDLPDAGVRLARGDTVWLVHSAKGRARGLVPPKGVTSIVPVPVPGLLEQARRGDVFLLKDGLLRVRVTRPGHEAVAAKVELGGTLYSRQGIALPGACLSIPAVTTEDRRDIRFGIDVGADFFALSFVGSAADVRRAKRLAAPVPVIAKIERREALADLPAIAAESDGVIVARGDLGVELGPAQVPLAQKRILLEARRAGRFAILATQMLSSMEDSPQPTRAEATDVANGVLDGADGLLLTGETANGKDPVAALRRLSTLVDEVEQSAAESRPATVGSSDLGAQHALAHAAIDAARSIDAAALVVPGRAAPLATILSGLRARTPIVALAPDAVAARALGTAWGVVADVATGAASREPRMAIARARDLLGIRRAGWYVVLHEDGGAQGTHLSLLRG